MSACGVFPCSLTATIPDAPQMMVGGPAFARLEEIYAGKCDLKGWLTPTTIACGKGRSFARAFKLHCIITLLNARTWPLGRSVRVVSRVDAQGNRRCGLEATAKEIVEHYLPVDTEHRQHTCDVPGCGGRIHDDAPVSKCLVMDGVEVPPIVVELCYMFYNMQLKNPSLQNTLLTMPMRVQNYTGQQCTFFSEGQHGYNCKKMPAIGKRFCHEHSKHEKTCAAYRPLPDTCKSLSPTSSLATMSTAFHRLGSHSPVVGVRCANPAEEGSLACDDPLCQAILLKFRQRPQLEDVLPGDNGTKEKQVRELCWQKIHDKQFVPRNALIGYFFYVCPCGALRQTQCRTYGSGPNGWLHMYNINSCMFCSAGVIEGYYPQECPENYTSNLEFLDTKLFPLESPYALPDFLFYDRACFLAACFGKSLQTFSERWAGLKWRVDRFHFLGHSAQDRHCRFVPASCILHMRALNVYRVG